MKLAPELALLALSIFYMPESLALASRIDDMSDERSDMEISPAAPSLSAVEA